jgi:hypothetical protein
MSVGLAEQTGQRRGAGRMHAGARRHLNSFQIGRGLFPIGGEDYLEKRLDSMRDLLMNGSSLFSASVQPD